MKVFKILLHVLILFKIIGTSLSIENVSVTPKNFEKAYLSYTKKIVDKLQCDSYTDKRNNGLINHFIRIIFNKDKKLCCSNVSNVDFIIDEYNLIWNKSINLKNQLYARVRFQQTCEVEKVILPISLLQNDIITIVECDNNMDCDKSKLERSCRVSIQNVVDSVMAKKQLSTTVSCLERELKKPILSDTIQKKQTLALLPDNYNYNLFKSLEKLTNKLNPITYSDLKLKRVTKLISEINTLLVKLWVVQVENPNSLNLNLSEATTQACNTSRLHTDLELIKRNINKIKMCVANKNCNEKEPSNTKRVLSYLIDKYINNYNESKSEMKLCFKQLFSHETGETGR